MAGHEVVVMAKKKSAARDVAASRAVMTPATSRRRSTAGAAAPRTRPGNGAAPTHEEIAEAAYHRYLSRQGGHGSDFDDWLEAERDLRSRRSR